MRQTINVTGFDIPAMVIKAYQLSVPMGMGFLHYNPAPMTREQAEALVEPFLSGVERDVNFDYLSGRCMKFGIWREGDQLLLFDKWYDHTDEELHQVLLAGNPEYVAS